MELLSKTNLKKSIEVHFSRSNTFPLYFYDTFDINLQEKMFGRSTAYSCKKKKKKNGVIGFHHFMKKNIDTGAD